MPIFHLFSFIFELIFLCFFCVFSCVFSGYSHSIIIEIEFQKINQSWPNVKDVEHKAIHFVQSVLQEYLPNEEDRHHLHPSVQYAELTADRLKG